MTVSDLVAAQPKVQQRKAPAGKTRIASTIAITIAITFTLSLVIAIVHIFNHC